MTALHQFSQGLIHHLATAIDQDDSLTNRFDFVHDVGRQNNGMPCFPVFGSGEVRNQTTNLTNLNGVETDCGFVKDQDRRVVDDRAGKPDSLPEPLRQVANHPVSNVVQTAAVRRAFDGLLPRRTRNVLDLRDERQICIDRHLRIERRVFRQISDRTSRTDGVSEDLVPGDVRGSVCHRYEAREHAHRRRLPRTVRPEKTDDLSLLDLERKVRHRFDIAIALGKVPRLDGQHLGLPPIHIHLLRRAKSGASSFMHRSVCDAGG